MTQTAQRVLDQFRELSERDQVEVSDVIAGEQGIRTDLEYVTAWSAELQDRIRRHESGEEPGIPWEQLRKELLEEDEQGE